MEQLAYLTDIREVEVKDVKDCLPMPQPAWLVGLDGTVIAANLLMLWLWGVLSPDLLQSKKLPQLRTFDIFTQNFNRIPLARNRDFFEKKSLTARVIESYISEELIQVFKQRMSSDLQLREIYENVRIDDLPRTLGFELDLMPPEELISPELLQFQVQVSATFDSQANLIGWGTVYTPCVERTQSVLLTKYNQLIDEYSTIQYVMTNVGETYDVAIDKIKKEIPKSNNSELSNDGNNAESSKASIELIELRFSEEQLARGRQILQNLGVSLHVTRVEENGLIYILSSTRWKEVENALKNRNISYEHKPASRFSKTNSLRMFEKQVREMVKHWWTG